MTLSSTTTHHLPPKNGGGGGRRLVAPAATRDPKRETLALADLVEVTAPSSSTLSCVPADSETDYCAANPNPGNVNTLRIFAIVRPSTVTFGIEIPWASPVPNWG